MRSMLLNVLVTRNRDILTLDQPGSPGHQACGLYAI